ncbi:DNA recombination protein RmuC [Gordonia jinhuaensis]|uniref:DNA recombination protein RmuC n=1 Tax=Gordonia jinhuaensis TaxID=1517702 RepID=A0A916TGF8_9ACTN|nr:DNA recombination protein RmuC [Gordonia jinhuaensis]GGB43988.1 hypothetical protein GCM10011489_34410 [Gordonia jinhuaensis]
MSASTAFAAVLLLAVGLAAGVAIGWLIRAGRDAASVAGARAELAAVRESHELLLTSVAAASEDAARRQSGAIGTQVSQIVGPLRETLDALGDQLHRTELDRRSAYTGLTEQVGEMRLASARLGTQTHRLASALRTPHVRGRWGEMHLRRVVELSGLTEHCDFDLQTSGSSEHSGGVRPDMVVHLTGGRSVIVDAKVPLTSYLEAVEYEGDGTPQDSLLREHARALRAHVTALSAKKYWAAFDPSPELVVLFIPADPILEAALRYDSDLLEYAFARNVVVATPTSLVALLRTVAVTWRHDALTRDAATILALGRELHHRIGTVCGHLDKLGTSLNRSVDSFNSAIGAMESRVAVTARKLGEMESLAGGTDDAPPELVPVDQHAREVSTTRLGNAV